MSQIEASARAEKKNERRRKTLVGLTYITVEAGANGTTSKQPIRFEQTLTAEFTIVNTILVFEKVSSNSFKNNIT